MSDERTVAEVLGALHPAVTIDDNGRGSAQFHPQPEHRGNPDWLHGGLAATVLDHVCARVASAALDGARVVTGRLDLRYRQPVPLAGGPFTVEAQVVRARSRSASVTGAIRDGDGRALVAASALFVRRP